jgi:hypothetical protein
MGSRTRVYVVLGQVANLSFIYLNGATYYLAMSHEHHDTISAHSQLY